MSSPNEPSNLVRTDVPEPPASGWMEYIRDFGKMGLEKLLEKVPLVDVYRTAVEYAANKAREREIETFFRLVAKHSEARHQIALLVDVANGIDRPHVHQAVAEGYEEMRNCVDEAAKPCIAVLVGQHMYETGPSTAYFRSAAQVLGASDAAQLRDIRRLVIGFQEAVASMGEKAPISGTVVICSAVGAGFDGLTNWISLRTATNEWAHSTVEAAWATRKHLQSVLTTAGFCYGIDGFTYHVSRDGFPGGSAWLDIHPAQLPWFPALGKCLDALDA